MWQQKIWSWSTEIKRSWFENVNTTVALRTTATTNNLTGSSIQIAIISIAQFSPPFSNVVTTDNIMHYPLKLKDADLSSWKMEEKGTTGKDFSIDHKFIIDTRGSFQYEAIKMTIIKQNLTFRFLFLFFLYGIAFHSTSISRLWAYFSSHFIWVGMKPTFRFCGQAIPSDNFGDLSEILPKLSSGFFN